KLPLAIPGETMKRRRFRCVMNESALLGYLRWTMAPLRFLAPFGFLALVPLGALLGGGWTLAAAVATGLALALLDSAFGKESRPGQAGGSAALRGVPAIYVLLQLAVTVWIGFRIAGGN